MSNQKYDAIWVKGSFFEKGHWRLVPKADSGGGAIGALIAIGIVVFIIFCLILTLPLWISLLGFSMVKSKRYYAGIGSVLALLYFFIDIYKNWISGYLLFGYYSSSGAFNEGLFGEKFAIYFYVINGVGTLIALMFLLESEYIINENGTQSNVKKLIVIGFLLLIIGLGFYSISTKSHNRINTNNESTVASDSLASGVEEVNDANQDAEVQFVAYPNDTLPKAKLNAEKVYFYFEPNSSDRTSYYFKSESKDMIVNYSDRKNGFLYVYNDSQIHNGWMWVLESDFELIDDVISDENSYLSVGKTYDGGTIIYLDDTKEHGILCSDVIITDRVNSLEISRRKSLEYIVNDSKNWRLPSKSDFILIYKSNLIDLKEESYWTSFEDSEYGLVYESFNNSFSSSRKNWESSALIFVKDF